MYAACRGTWSAQRAAWVGRTAPAAGRGRLSRRSLAAELIIGCDLGTSNSAAAAIDKETGAARVLRGPDGNASVPSVVAIAQDGTTLVGQQVVDPPPGYTTPFSRRRGQADSGAAVAISTADTFHSFKRLIGKSGADAAEEAASLGFNLGEGDRSEALLYSPALDDMVSPEELSAWVLKHLREAAEKELGEPVAGAVVTVPAHFGQAQQGATHAAAQQAGFTTVQLLQEPVAAALAYGINGGTDGDTVLVFDVGGGTFDISILQAFEGIMEVLGTAGDSNLGGNDFDALLADWLLEECAAQGVDVRYGSSSGSVASSSEEGSAAAAPPPFRSQQEQREWARGAAEDAKVALSSGDAAQVALPGGGSLTLTTAQFEAVTSRLFQLMANVLEALGDALFVEWAVRPSDAVRTRQQPAEGSRGSDDSASASTSGGGATSSGDRWAPPPRRITQVALVGQLTRLPSVQQFVARVTGVEPLMTVDPAEAVALGAAIHAGVLLGQVSGVELMDGSYSQDLHDRATGFSGWQP